MWKRTADEANRYREQNIPVLAASPRTKLLKRQQKDPGVSVPSVEEIMSGLQKFKSIKAHEIVHVIALLFARAVAPIRDGLAGHWRQGEDGAIPRGTFSRYMKRERFEVIMEFLHLNDSSNSSAAQDRAWKIRPVLQTVEKTFRRGYRLGKSISFDEGMIPNRSNFNPVRAYMPNKPSNYGTKFYHTC